MSNRRKTLGGTELEVLNIVWESGPSTVAQVHATISRTRDVAYTTIMTVAKNLQKKGYLSYTMDGRTFVYRAVRSAEDVRSGLVRELVQSAFLNSPLALALTLVRDEQLSSEELDALKRAISNLEEAQLPSARDENRS